ncbi:hypothetical protein [Evansella tamaricis]|uniref:Uncharacterized protein n=1 Tax=Evansella tamaricis TaxID=2069301 RepID=A0ABS6JL66_9BACI|nr:hypothetical protein [Evansella tamaricis]MBU9714417.1 hypothetical protein [Evansella tamaricis]
MSEDIKLQYGKCDVYVDGEKAVDLIGEACTFTATPQYEDIDLYEIPNYDKSLEGWEVTFSLVLEDYAKEKLELGMPMLSNQLGALVDGRLGQRARDKAVELRIRPRGADITDTQDDLVIYKAFPVSPFEKTYGKEKSTWTIEFEALSKTADPSQAGNYFSIGEELQL